MKNTFRQLKLADGGHVWIDLMQVVAIKDGQQLGQSPTSIVCLVGATKSTCWKNAMTLWI